MALLSVYPPAVADPDILKGKGGRQYIAYAHNELYAFVLPEKKRLTTII